MSEEHGQTVVGFRQSEVPPYSKVQSIGALPGGIGRSGTAGSKELDLCYNFRFLRFSILATRRSGNPASVAAPQIIHTQVDLTRVEYKIVRPKLFVRERHPNSFDSTRHLGPTPPDQFGVPVFVQLTVAPLLIIPLSAARK